MKIFAKILVCAIKTKRFLVRSQMNDLEKMACPLWQSRNDVHVRITTRTQCWLLGQLWRWKFDGFPPDLKKQLNKIKYLGVNSCPILIILINIIIGWYELRKAKVPCPRYRWWRGQANFRFAIQISPLKRKYSSTNLFDLVIHWQEKENFNPKKGRKSLSVAVSF